MKTPLTLIAAAAIAFALAAASVGAARPAEEIWRPMGGHGFAFTLPADAFSEQAAPVDRPIS